MFKKDLNYNKTNSPVENIFKKGLMIISMLLLFSIVLGMASASDSVSVDAIGGEVCDDSLAIDSSSENVLRDSSSDDSSVIWASSNSENNIGDVALGRSNDNDIESLSSNIVKPSGKTFNDVQKAANNAKANSVIQLDGTYNANSNKTLVVNKSLIFEGNGTAVLDAKSKAGFEICNKANVIFRNIIFKNFNYDYDYDFEKPCGFFFYGKNLTLSNCSFINSGLSVNGQNLSISNSIFTNAYLMIYNEGDLSSISNCNFSKSSINEWHKNWLCVKNSNFFNKSTISVRHKLKVVNCNFKENKNGNETIFKDFYGSITLSNKNKTLKYTSGDNIVFTDSLKAYKLWYVKPVKNVATYNSGERLRFKLYKGYFKKLPAANWPLRIEISRGKKVWNYWGKYDSIETTKSGYISLKTSGLKLAKDMFDPDYTVYNTKKGKSKLAAGTYKIYISNIGGNDALDSDYSDVFFSYNGIIKIRKAPTSVKAHKMTAKAKRYKYFKVTVKQKSNKKALKGIKVKLRIYTGKKFKTYTVKTNKKGVAKFNTRKLKRGIHKVEILSGNSNYYINRTSSIRIK